MLSRFQNTTARILTLARLTQAKETLNSGSLSKGYFIVNTLRHDEKQCRVVELPEDDRDDGLDVAEFELEMLMTVMVSKASL
ncbi:hypothetical protein CVT26_013045 [Gymnopilus dilepis]|uniref:Uncharacterized protein n=1 Tax=Gymnopilus dilepis TaxID=231916 RepID=A0A409Y4B2_9AGAR|nr:hypothetical protein CVT26_013045 [Gymnopilus dilepis]